MTGVLIPGISVEDFKILLHDAVNSAIKNCFFNVYESQNKKEILTRKETAEFLGVTLATLNAWEKANILTPVRIGSRVRYRIEDVKNSFTKSQLRVVA